MESDSEVVVPEFLRELEADEVGADEAASFVARLEGQSEPPVSSRFPTSAHLLALTSTAPLKYGPFYDRVGDLLGVDEAEVEHLLGSTEFRRSPLWGIKYKMAPLRKGAHGQAATLVWFAPGTRYPHHGHDHDERLLILEGGYTDSSGKVYEAGDLHEMPAGTEHDFRVHASGPCVAIAVADQRLKFTSPFLRVLARLIGR